MGAQDVNYGPKPPPKKMEVFDRNFCIFGRKFFDNEDDLPTAQNLWHLGNCSVPPCLLPSSAPPVTTLMF